MSAQHSTAQHSTAQHSTAQHSTNRIEYLDALRGFTMILVILNHVAAFDFGVDVFHAGNFHFYLQKFRMPLFFFVSGFLVYKSNFVWNLANIKSFLSKKIVVQIISPLIFLLCYIFYKDYDVVETLTHASKRGYWFTFALFNYFIVYIAVKALLGLKKVKEGYALTTLLLIGAVLYILPMKNILLNCGIPVAVLNLCSVEYMFYFIFFVLGACVKRYFKQFESLIDNYFLLTIAIVVYFVVNIVFDYTNERYLVAMGTKFILAICGIVITFGFFRKNESFFASENKVAKTLKFIGKRTLDIYLLHYFFLSHNLPNIFPFFTEHNLPLFEFTASLFVTAIVISACLFISSVLRTSNTLAHFLFGAKSNKKA